MANEMLSQDEIDALLSAISSGDEPAEETGIGKETKKQKGLRIYDFSRPEKISKDQQRILQMIHETFARLMTTSLSGVLRTMVYATVANVDQLTYDEFIRSIPNPTTLGIFDMRPLTGNAIIEAEPRLIFTIIDKMFGGQGEVFEGLERGLTEVEQAVVHTMITKILSNLTEAWANIVELRPRLDKIETNPNFAQIVQPSEMVVLITIETKIGEVDGMINLCIPVLVIEPVMAKLTAQHWFSNIQEARGREYIAALKEKMNVIRMPVDVKIGKCTLRTDEVLNLHRGDVITLDTKPEDPFVMNISNQPKFWVKPGILKYKKAVQIVGKIVEEGGDIIE